LLTVIALWTALSLVTAPVIGALIVSRHRRQDPRRRMDRHVSVNEPRPRGKESPGPNGGKQGHE